MSSETFEKEYHISEKSPYHGEHFKLRKERTLRTLAFILLLIAAIIWGSGFLINAVDNFSAHNSVTFNELKTPHFFESPPLLTKGNSHGQSGKIPLTLEHIREGKFRPQFKNLQWILAPESATHDQGTYLLEDKQGDNTTYVVKSILDSDFHYVLHEGSSFTYNGETYDIDALVASPDLTRAVLKTETVKSWRHSSFAIYWVLDVKTQTIAPLFNTEDRVAVTSWAPTSDKIAFIYENNVFIKDLIQGDIIQVTYDGGEQTFYGKPDWVYEEEVFASDIVLWWSPQGDKLGFLKFNDSEVPDFPIPYYVQDGFEEYPELVNIKYPKPGYPNPKVDLVLYNLEARAESEPEKARVAQLNTSFDDKLITEVLWVSDDYLLVKTSNRASDELEVFLVNTDDSKGELVRKHHAKDSWFEVTSNAIYVPRNESAGIKHDGYIDLIVHEGYNHLAYFSPPESSEGKLLTSGQWEVLTNVFDFLNNEIYFLATKKSSVERHIYSVSLTDAIHSQKQPSIKNVTDVSAEGWFGASFSSGARFALVSNQGPSVPYQNLIDLHSKEIVQEIENNHEISVTLEEYDVPQTTYFLVNLGIDEVTGGEILANAKETKPRQFDPSKKYPVLFFVYGGPGSQTVTKTFDVGFSEAIASELDAVVVTVDGRGTGYNTNDSKLGSRFKFIVRDRLGHYEPIDQIAAASIWAKKPYVDSSRIAIWGWSYGGFLTLKTLETDNVDHVFSYGVSVAPVTKWRLYDSIYTERYLRTPQENPSGYESASIYNMTNFKDVKRFLVMHGSGDDNVHFQNSLSLIDDFNLAGVENFDFMVFPDSDHLIRYHNGNNVVFDRIKSWIGRAFAGEFA
ncbi:hypothetical protein C7M61_004459 [Candidozyma pseudohaemuli]|uniref:Dipeptidyl aminopeptidase B n=1 Tax=Candidozyma pseudohaemuli TaxID=418784 RepID=A0A2P7YI77_9ASCO|nr:hypothetical protein C7M61_004459 [[Candida] pseudohaemulonii]PSK35670.1 hypothetical protein C7M61_004459 [[Candida] pseudohaemulonii]